MTLSVNVMASNTAKTDDIDISLDETQVIEFNDDYSEVIVNGTTYYSVNNSRFDYDYDREYYISYENIITEGDNTEEILFISMNILVEETYISITIDTINGNYYDYYYLNKKYYDNYANIVSGNVDDAYIDFLWPEDNRVETAYNKLTENEATEINVYDSEHGYYLFDNNYTVYSYLEDIKLGIQVGNIYTTADGEVYYCNDLENRQYLNANVDSDCYYMHHITDEQLLADIDEAYALYTEDLEIFDDDIPEKISKVFFVFIFAILPLSLAILAIILLIKLPKKYRKTLITLLILSVLEIIVFISLGLLLF
jgi:hypothetical protein